MTPEADFSAFGILHLIEAQLFQTYELVAEYDVARALARLHSDLWKSRLTGAACATLYAEHLEVVRFLGVDDEVVAEADRFLVWTIPTEIASRLQTAIDCPAPIGAIEAMLERLLGADGAPAARLAA